jgi:hypothetical protein
MVVWDDSVLLIDVKFLHRQGRPNLQSFGFSNTLRSALIPDLLPASFPFLAAGFGWLSFFIGPKEKRPERGSRKGRAVSWAPVCIWGAISLPIIFESALFIRLHPLVVIGQLLDWLSTSVAASVITAWWLAR